MLPILIYIYFLFSLIFQLLSAWVNINQVCNWQCNQQLNWPKHSGQVSVALNCWYSFFLHWFESVPLFFFLPLLVQPFSAEIAMLKSFLLIRFWAVSSIDWSKKCGPIYSYLQLVELKYCRSFSLGCKFVSNSDSVWKIFFSEIGPNWPWRIIWAM